MLSLQGDTNKISYSDEVQHLGTTVLAAATWYHVALVRSSGSVLLFVDGVSQFTALSDTRDLAADTGTPIIGRPGDGDFQGVNGWIDELRVSKGVARWTTNFTPPTAAYG